MTHDAFISYSHRDKAVADAICASLENHGIRCWIAPRDIAPGEDWPSAIAHAISNNRLMVLVFSANSNASEDVGREIILAANHKLVIIPFKIENIEPEPGKQYYLARTHWLDAINPPTQEQIDLLIRVVRSFLDTGKASGDIAPVEKAAAAPPPPVLAGKAGRRRIPAWVWIPIILLVVIGGVLLTNFITDGNLLRAVWGDPMQAQTPAAPVTIMFWHQYTDNKADALEMVLEKYMADHPDVTIVSSYKGVNSVDSDFSSSIKDLLDTSVATGQGPDFIVWDHNNVIPFNAPTGTIVPLDDLGITQDWMLSQYELIQVNGMRYQEKTYGLPLEQGGVFIIYNRSLASTTDFPSDPLDFPGLLDRLGQYQDANGIPLLCFEQINVYFMSPIFFAYGLPAYVDNQGKVYLDTPQARAALEWLVSIKPLTVPDMQEWSCGQAFLEGKVAAVWTGPWKIREIRQTGIDFGVVAMGRPYVGGVAAIMTRNAVDRGHEQIALDIMKYLASAEVQVLIATEVYSHYAELPDFYITASTKALDSPEIQALPNMAEMTRAYQLGTALPTDAFGQLQWIPLTDVLNAAWEGSQTPAEALAAAQQTLEGLVAGIK